MLIKTIFQHLLTNEKYYSIVYPYLNDEIIEDEIYRKIFYKVKAYSEKYSKQPNINDIKLLINTDISIKEDETKNIKSTLTEFEEISNENINLVIDETENWIKIQEYKNAIMIAIDNIEKQESLYKSFKKAEDAISISFSDDLGMNWGFDCKRQLEFYTTEEEVMKCSVDIINQALGGGVRKRSINCVVGKSNVGKTLFLCHLASDYVLQGYNVLYVSAEMGDKYLYQRMDANILDTQMDDLGETIKEKDYFTKVKSALKQKPLGKLWIKEYPVGTANKLHIQNYIKELKLKKGFEPDIVILDYLNIFASCRLPSSAASDSYKYVKAITEEMRAMASENNVAIWTATQFNKTGSQANAKESDMTGTADSFGVPMTLDTLFALIQSPELYEAGKYLFKVLKSRFGDNVNKVYTMGVERKKMRLFDVDEDEQELPIHEQDKMKEFDLQRKLKDPKDNDGDDVTFVFGDEL